MAQALRVTIALAGAEEIKRQLEGIGEAGQEAFASIAKEANKIGSFNNLDPTLITKKLEQFGVKGKDAIDKINNAVKTAGRFENLVQGLDLVERALMRAGLAGKGLLLVFGPIGATIAIVATLIGVALVGAVVKAAQSISALERQAIALGVSLESLSKLKAGLGAAGIPFDAVSKGLQHLQQQIDKFNLGQVEKAFSEAQKNIALGWGPGADNLKILQKAAEGIGPAADAARKALEALGQPVTDNVTPALEGMVRWAGSAAAAIPLIAGELDRLRSAGEKTRFLSEIFKQIAAEAPTPVAALETLIGALEKIPASAERDKAVLDALGTELGTRLVQALRAAAAGSQTAVSEFLRMSKGIKGATGDAVRQIDLDINKIKAGLSAMFENIPIERLTGAMSTFANATTAAFNSGTTAVNQMNSAIDALIAKINAAINAMGQLGSSGGGGGGSAAGNIPATIRELLNIDNVPGNIFPGSAAGGGLLGGRGTGTSDSNLMWLSRGEHVMPARAVRQPGVLALLEALRRSGGNLRGVLDRMGHFAMGGVVGASGGGMSHVTIQFPGVAPISGLRASSAVVDELRRSAALAQVRSGGRKPSRYS